MKKITRLLFSMELSGMLLILFTVSIAIATFIENDFGTLSAKARVYNAKWFEIMLILLAVNMSGSIIKRKMYLPAKWPVFIFHVSFIIILLGAAVTRYVGYEGVMAIREGNTSNEMRTSDTFIRIWVDDGQSQAYSEKKVFATASEVTGFSESISINTNDVDIEVIDYVTNATEKYVEGEGGNELLWIVYANEHFGRQEIFLEKGNVKKIGNYSFAFEAELEGAGMRIFMMDEKLMFVSNDTMQHMDMITNEGLIVEPGTAYPFMAMNLYSSGSETIVLKEYMESVVKKLVRSDNPDDYLMDAFVARINVNGTSSTVNVSGGQGYLGLNSEIDVDGVKVIINYGVKVIHLPFSLKLDNFILDRYPGSNSPASYASEVTIVDDERSLVMPYRIYMNNILNYRGYRFFQSSYDKDEMGTILSVNHDTAGTIITYIGYLLMTIGMFFTLFIRKSRFRALLRKTSEVRLSRKNVSTIILIAFLISGLPVISVAQPAPEPEIPVIDKAHAEAFGKMQVLDKGGRLKPLNSLASELLRKIARKNTFQGMTPEQVFLGIMAFPNVWNEVPVIKVTHPQLKEYLGVEGKYTAFNQVVDIATTGEYKLKEYVEHAYAKKPSLQNKFDKDVIKVDERVNIYYMIYTGSFLSIFPIQGDVDNKWSTPGQSGDLFNAEDSTTVRAAFTEYIHDVINATQSDDWSAANDKLAAILAYQAEYGKDIYLPESKVGMEVFYNKVNVFKRLSMYYGLIGFILLILHFINIFKPRINLRMVIRIGSMLVFLLFLLHTAGLIMRWYISGHAPWSDGYESMIYIAWATALSGLIFVWRSGITLSVTALLASLILSVAGMNWMDPEITNLVPVLKSYWLIIHVAIITASYGFLALGALLGFLNLVFMIMKSKNNVERMNLSIKELNLIIEVNLIIGLFLLTIGTFLGGVWANESWGRYWGWDPKETWALATVVFYSFVVHMRFIPGLRGNFAFSFTSLISYGFVLMTYFGVNYYLSGLHSYASGDSVPVPNFVYYTIITILIVSVIAYVKDHKHPDIKKLS